VTCVLFGCLQLRTAISCGPTRSLTVRSCQRRPVWIWQADSASSRAKRVASKQTSKQTESPRFVVVRWTSDVRLGAGQCHWLRRLVLDGVQLEYFVRVKVAHGMELLANVLAKRHNGVAHRADESSTASVRSRLAELDLLEPMVEQQPVQFVRARRALGRPGRRVSKLVARLEPDAKFCSFSSKRARRPARIEPLPAGHFAARQIGFALLN
jgi:hypothetical protein